MIRAAAVVVLAACASSSPPPPSHLQPVTPGTEAACTTAQPATYAVMPFKNKTGKDVDVVGMSELLAVKMSNDPCLVLLERRRLQELIDEQAHCDANNPDRDQFDCDGAAQSGSLLGVKYYLFVDVVAYEPSIGAAELESRYNAHHLDASETYGAVILAVRAVATDTGKVIGGGTIQSIIPSVQAKLDTHSARTSPGVVDVMAQVSQSVHVWLTLPASESR